MSVIARQNNLRLYTLALTLFDNRLIKTGDEHAWPLTVVLQGRRGVRRPATDQSVGGGSEWKGLGGGVTVLPPHRHGQTWVHLGIGRGRQRWSVSGEGTRGSGTVRPARHWPCGVVVTHGPRTTSPRWLVGSGPSVTAEEGAGGNLELLTVTRHRVVDHRLLKIQRVIIVSDDRIDVRKGRTC